MDAVTCAMFMWSTGKTVKFPSGSTVNSYYKENNTIANIVVNTFDIV